MTFLSALSRRWQSFQPSLHVEAVALIVSVFFALACNTVFWKSSLSGRDFAQLATWGFATGLLVLLTAIHFILFAVVLNRWTLKLLLALIIVATAFASYYMTTYTVFLDPSMLRNILRTDIKEAGELFTFGMVPHLLLFAVLPLIVLWRIRLRQESLRRAFVIRLLSIAAGIVVGGGALLAIFHDFAPMMRNHKEIRYLITPANYLYSLTSVLGKSANAATRERLAIGTDAVKGAAWQQRTKPTLFVIVVGETARSANWGLSGYGRQTTPELAALDVINFSQTTSCGTNTEVSVPCLFSVYGRRHYDEDKIRNSESLLNVLDHAGFRVIWRDNQSGCKGVCTGVEEQKLANSTDPALCDGERCLDGILLKDLDRLATDAQGNLVLVLHQLGNHGPAYYKRYPPELRKFEPTCDTSELATCSRESVVNTYDNALLYTDHMLAQTIAFLKTQEARFDTAMIYFSDHGESLGENGLYLHGIPYSIAPKEQTSIPMVMWFSPGYAQDFSLDLNCLRQRAGDPASHDNLFHSILGMLDVKTSVYDAAMDISRSCRRAQ